MYVIARTGFGQVRAPAPAEPDVPVSQILRLSTATGKELSLRDELNVHIIIATDRKLIDEWWALLPELQDYLRLAGAELERRARRSREPTLLPRWVAKQWESVLAEAGATRQWLAARVKQHHDGKMKYYQKSLDSERESLRAYLNSLRRIEDAIKGNKRAMAVLKQILAVHDAGQKLQSILTIFVDPSKLPVEMASEIAGKVDKTADVIEKGVAMIASYGILLELAAEGYESVEAVKRRVTVTLQNIRNTVKLLSYHQRERSRAEAIERIPRVGQ